MKVKKIISNSSFKLSFNNIKKNMFKTFSKHFTYKWGKELGTDLDEFRKNAVKTIDYIADKHKNISNFQISPKHKPGFLDKIISDKAPEEPREYMEVLNEIDKNIINNYTLYNHPGFMANTNLTSYPAIIGNLISDAFNNPGVSWVANPGGFELERIVLDWLAEEFSLPENFKKVDSGCCVHLECGESASVVVLAARYKKKQEFQGKEHLFTYYYSSEANKAAAKSVYIGGGKAREIPVVWNKEINNYEMDIKALENQINIDIKAGLIPTFVYASLGNHNTTAIDNVVKISDLSKVNGMWCHVDASVLGNTLMLEENKKLLKGLENSNSIVIEGFRGLPVGIDSGFFWVDEAKYVFKALNDDFVLYVQFFKDNQAEMTNYHFGTARATKSIRLWMVLKAYGIDGLKGLLRKQVKFGKIFENKFREDSKRFNVFCNSNFGTSTFTLKNKSNDEIAIFVERVNADGKLFIASGEVKLNDKETIKYGRLCVNDLYINEERANEIFKILQSTYDKLYH